MLCSSSLIVKDDTTPKYHSLEAKHCFQQFLALILQNLHLRRYYVLKLDQTHH